MNSRSLYVHADTFIHRLHPNTKLLCLLLSFVAVMAFNHPAYEGAMVALGIILLGSARSLCNLARGWGFLLVLFVVSALLWVLFVKDIKDPRVVWSVVPVLVERGTTPYDLVMVMVISGLLALAIIALSLVQLLAHDALKTKRTPGWWVAFGVTVALGIAMGWRGHRLLPAMWMWYALLVAYFILASVVALRRLRTPYAVPLWLGFCFVVGLFYICTQGFLVHVSTEDRAYMWGPTLSISQQALLFGPAMGLRIVAFLIFGLVFISTTTPEQLTQGLRAMGLPVTPSVALTLAFRLVPTFLGTARTVMDAQRARGLDLDSGNALTRLKRTAPVIVPTLAYALRGADDLTRALETRGLGAAKQRTEYRPLQFGGLDWGAIVLTLALTLACVVARMHCGLGELLPRL